MKKSLRLLFASVVVIGGMATVSFGQTEDNNKPKSINERQQIQRERIRDGAKEGDLNKNELKRLAKDQAQIRQLERKARADGEVSHRERGRIQHELNQSSRHIRRARNN